MMRDTRISKNDRKREKQRDTTIETGINTNYDTIHDINYKTTILTLYNSYNYLDSF